MLRAFALALAATSIIEGAIIALICRRWRPVYCTLLCNLATNPALNLCVLGAVRWLGTGAYVPILAMLEVAVVLIEGIILRALCDWTTRRALGISLLLNAASFLAGIGLAAIAG